MHRECDRRGVNDTVTFSTDRFTLEWPNSSIVAQYGEQFVIPDPRIGILHGTAQRELFAWALQEGLATEYCKLPLARLREADHLYMTHGGWVIPVAALDDQTYEVDPAQIDQINDAIHARPLLDLTPNPPARFDVCVTKTA